MHPLVSARNYSTRVERYFPKETSDFFFPFFPPKKQEKRQGHTSGSIRTGGVEFPKRLGETFRKQGDAPEKQRIYRIYEQTRRIHGPWFPQFQRRRDGPRWMDSNFVRFICETLPRGGKLGKRRRLVRRVHLVAPPDCERTLQIGRKERLCHLRFTSNFISTRGKCMQIIPLANRGERAKAPPVITNSRDYPISLGQEAANTARLCLSRRSWKVVKSRHDS